MTEPIFRHVALLGTGLIGGSLAHILSERSLAAHIAVYDLNPDHAALLVKAGWAHSHHPQALLAAQGADLVILAAPPSALAMLAESIAPAITGATLITDIASVKRSAIAAILPHLPKLAHYVPAHPIAGSEKTGPEAARADLFTGKRVILTPDESELLGEPVARIRALWEAAGAAIDYMPASLHDRIYAYISHLPQLVAFAARKVIAPHLIADQRFARLMHSDAALWTDIFLANADYVLEALDGFTVFAAQIAGELSEAPDEQPEHAEAALNLFPVITATCLIAAVTQCEDETGIPLAHYAGTGFTDMTASASSDPEAALAAISTQPRSVARYLLSLLGEIQLIANAIRSGSAAEAKRTLYEISA